MTWPFAGRWKPPASNSSTRTAAVRVSASASGSGQNNLSKPRLLRLRWPRSESVAEQPAAIFQLTARRAGLSRAFLAPQRQLDNIGQYRPDESWDGRSPCGYAPRQNEPSLVEIV